MINRDNIVPKLENMTIECEEIKSIITAIEDGLSSGYGKFGRECDNGIIL